MMMKTAAWAAALLFFCFNATADVPVFLKTHPAGDVTKGTPITFTADLGRQIAALDKSRLRYTFNAQRTWPCAESFVMAKPIGARPAIGMVTWTPPKAGIYTFEGRSRLPATAEDAELTDTTNRHWPSCEFQSDADCRLHRKVVANIRTGVQCHRAGHSETQRVRRRDDHHQYDDVASVGAHATHCARGLSGRLQSAKLFGRWNGSSLLVSTSRRRDLQLLRRRRSSQPHGLRMARKRLRSTGKLRREVSEG
jgi:hypothetical protein